MPSQGRTREGHPGVREAMSKLGDGQPKESGTWDYYGYADPDHSRSSWQSFSVGVFQWIPKAGGGTKRGTVRRRFTGFVSDPQSVYSKALEYIEFLTPTEES